MFIRKVPKDYSPGGGVVHGVRYQLMILVTRLRTRTTHPYMGSKVT